MVKPSPLPVIPDSPKKGKRQAKAKNVRVPSSSLAPHPPVSLSSVCLLSDMLRALLAGPKRTRNRGYKRPTSSEVEETVERESAREDKTPQAQLASSVLAPFGRFCWWQGSRVKAGGPPRSSPPSAAASQMEL